MTPHDTASDRRGRTRRRIEARMRPVAFPLSMTGAGGASAGAEGSTWSPHAIAPAATMTRAATPPRHVWAILRMHDLREDVPVINGLLNGATAGLSLCEGIARAQTETPAWQLVTDFRRTSALQCGLPEWIKALHFRRGAIHRDARRHGAERERPGACTLRACIHPTP